VRLESIISCQKRALSLFDHFEDYGFEEIYAGQREVAQRLFRFLYQLYQFSFFVYFGYSESLRARLGIWWDVEASAFTLQVIGYSVACGLVCGVLFGVLKSATLSAAFSGMFIIGETKPKPENMVWRLFMSLRLTAPIRGAPSM